MECLECAITLPLYPTKCNRVTLPGGIKGFILAKCGVTFTDPTYADLAEWQTKLTAGDVVSTGMKKILGFFPEAAEFAAKLGSCDPDELLNFEHSADITDHASELLTVGFKQDTFYNTLNTQYDKMQVGFITCDDRFYGFIESFSVIAKRQLENNNKDGKTFWHSVFKWQGKSHPVPVYVPGLGSLLQNPA